MSSATTTLCPSLGGHQLDVRYAPLLGATVILHFIGPTTLCAIHPDTPGLRGYWLDPSTLPHAVDWVERHNAAGRNIYFALNAPVAGLATKPSKSEIIDLRGVPADVDAKNGRSIDEAFDVIGQVGIDPTLIIATGGGFQPVWRLPEPLPATEDNVRRVEAAGKRIARLTGGDAVHDIGRILRLPFTKNFPNKKKRDAGRVVCCSGLLLPQGGGSHGRADIRMGSVE
jgi:hypothetical protein